MKKIKEMSGDTEGVNFSLALVCTSNPVSGRNVYGIVGETKDDLCFVSDIGSDLSHAEALFDKLFRFAVLPCTLADVVHDLCIISAEKKAVS